VQRFPAMSPPTRRGHAMVYDKERGVVVLFGGWGQAGGGYMNDTWEWNGANWAQRTPTTIPSSRSGHALAYDNLHNRVVLFGGRNPTPLNDTWEWNGADWVRQNPISLPPARYRHAMAYDDTRERVVVFGGNDGSNDLNDTWEWNGADWTQAVPATSPPERTYHAVAYDSIRRCLVLFGGSDDDQQFDDTWEYRFLSLSVSPATQTVVRGQTASFPGSVEGTLSSVTLTVVALPGGVSGQFLPSSPLTPPVQITLVLTTSFVTSDGVHPVILVGQAAGLTTSVPLTLEVTPSYYVFLPFVLSGDHTKAQSSPTARCTNER
jgi:hypothetical protein